ncbi:OTU domain-containing protein 3 isoform X2 [Anolis carolinensis]|uniref:OTU domain-containing protein 3 isoform X2 n=1 Tax=Anolis carolinensis TaxID=28377 RepID=UPI002F2B29B1
MRGTSGSARGRRKAMSRKQQQQQKAGKRDERAARRAQALAREKKNRPPGGEGAGEGGLAAQLRALGLRLREVPGDGNCLFRALGDQLEGHSQNHLRHRQETVAYMRRQRPHFEPFVEDELPFDKHLANLSQPGTFAGNDAIVAFAKNNQVNVVIHQLNAPLWQIRGTDKANARELHIAYRYGEHYDSVRKINDNEEAPARLQTEMLCRKDSGKKEEFPWKEEDAAEPDAVEDAVQKVRNATGCMDSDLILQILETEDYNIESAVFAVSQVNEVQRLQDEAQANRPKPGLWEENGSGTRIFGNPETENNRNPAEGNPGSRKPQNPKRKEQQRQEKKRRQEDRHRHKARDNNNKDNDNDNNRKKKESPAEADPEVTLVKTVAALNI